MLSEKYENHWFKNDDEGNLNERKEKLDYFKALMNNPSESKKYTLSTGCLTT